MMKAYFSKTIYLVIFFLYIFAMYVSPLGLTSEGTVLIESKSEKTINQPKLKVRLYADVLGVTQKDILQKEVYSMHQYDDLAHQDYQFEDVDSQKSIVSSTPAAYTYHNNELNDKEVLGFVPYWELGNYNSIDYSKLSTIAYFALTSDSGGSWVSDSGYTGFNSVAFSNMVANAHANDVKVVLVAKNFDPLSIRNIINNTGGAGDRLINRIASAISSKGLDGVNVDFEYVPSVSADTVTGSLRAKFVDWHRRLAERIHADFPKSHVSTDVFGSSAVGYTIYDMENLGKSGIDNIIMMTYDYITTRCYEGKYMSPMSPLYGNSGYNTSTHLQAGANLSGSKKIMMGIPYYGIDFQVKSAQRESYNALVDYPNCDGRIETYKSIVSPTEDAYHNSTTIRWNNSEKARWYVYNYAGKWRQGYYDDPLSLGAKYDFVRSANLGGIAIWVLGYDGNAKEMYNVIRDKFQKVPFFVTFGYGVGSNRVNSILGANNVTLTDTLGNNTFEVTPNSEVSGVIMNKLRIYKEVIDVRFDLDGVTRDINQ